MAYRSLLPLEESPGLAPHQLCLQILPGLDDREERPGPRPRPTWKPRPMNLLRTARPQQERWMMCWLLSPQIHSPILRQYWHPKNTKLYVCTVCVQHIHILVPAASCSVCYLECKALTLVCNRRWWKTPSSIVTPRDCPGKRLLRSTRENFRLHWMSLRTLYTLVGCWWSESKAVLDYMLWLKGGKRERVCISVVKLIMNTWTINFLSVKGAFPEMFTAGECTYKNFDISK